MQVFFLRLSDMAPGWEYEGGNHCWVYWRKIKFLYARWAGKELSSKGLLCLSLFPANVNGIDTNGLVERSCAVIDHPLIGIAIVWIRFRANDLNCSPESFLVLHKPLRSSNRCCFLQPLHSCNDFIKTLHPSALKYIISLSDNWVIVIPYVL